MRTYLYHQQILCRSSVQAEILSKLLLPPEAAFSESGILTEAAGESGNFNLVESASKKAKLT
jgi:hypothetical protein